MTPTSSSWRSSRSRFLIEADRRGPVAAFALAAFLESLFLPLFIDALLLALVLRGAPLRRMVMVAIPASALGTLFWYGAGMMMGAQVLTGLSEVFAISPDIQSSASAAWANNWPLAIIAASLSAIPDPLVAALAGIHGAPLLGVIGLILAGHAIRFGLMAVIVAMSAWLARRGGGNVSAWVGRLSLIVGLGASVILGGLMIWRIMS